MKLVWFRRDLRTDDHPALGRARGEGDVTALVVHDENIRRSAAPLRLAFYDGAVEGLAEELKRAGIALRRRTGRAEEVVPHVVSEVHAGEVLWTLERGPGAARDERVRTALDEAGVDHRAEAGDLAVEPDQVDRGGTFAAYFRGWREASRALSGREPYGELPSPLSPHLRFGLLSPRRVVGGLGPEEAWDEETARFARSLAWRDYAYWLAERNPQMLEQGLEPWARYLEWRQDPEALQAWQEGRTGYPIIDASMRQLAAEGFIPNSHRMAVGSFLTKHLGVHWREGARWFTRTLVDGDPVVNAMNWQWVASVGVERAGYIRILSPERQAERLDPDGSYARRWIPELGTEDYPLPIVEHRQAREEALERYRRAKARAKA